MGKKTEREDLQLTIAQITPTVRSSWWIVSFPVCGSFKHSMGKDRIDKQTIWKYIWYCYQDKTNHYYFRYCKCCRAQWYMLWYWYRRWVSETAIVLQWCCAKILLHLVPYPNDSLTNSNQPQNIVSHLVLDQPIVLHLVPGQTIELYLVPCPRQITWWSKPHLVLDQTIVLHLVPENP